jgi:MFS family permease
MSAPARTAAPQPPPPLHRNLNFALLWTSQTLSSLGTRVSGIGFPLLVLAFTGSPAQAGLVGFAQTLPFPLLFLPAGALVDRHDRKRIMQITELCRLLAMASLAAAVIADQLTIWHLLVVGFIEGAGLVFFELSEAAALPHIVPDEQLPTAIAQNQARQQAAGLLGQPLGGLLFSAGRVIPFAFDAITYLISLGAVSAVSASMQDRRDDEPSTDASISQEIIKGVTFLWNQPFLRALSVLMAAANFVLGGLALTVVVKLQDLGASPAVIGFATAAFAVGSLVGTSVAPAIQRRLPGRSIFAAAGATWAVTTALLIPADHPALVALAFGTGAVIGPATNVMVGRYRYALVPDELLGRVTSASRVLGWGVIPLGPIAAGAAIEGLGIDVAIAGLAAIMAAVAVAALVLPGLRTDPLADRADQTDQDDQTGQDSQTD